MEDKPHRFLYKIILALVIVILIIIFSLQNNANTTVTILFWQASLPLILLFLLSFIVGILITLIGIMPVIRASRSKSLLIKTLMERVDKLEKENTKLTK